MEYVQLEFPFTATGALQHYNIEQVNHMQGLYKEFVRNSDLRHSKSLFDTWVEVYVKANSVTYSNQHRIPESALVEYHNDKVLMRWKHNTLSKKHLEDLI